MRLSFKLESGENLDFVVPNETVTIGRSNRCDIVIPDEGVSRQHIKLEVDVDKLFLTDLGSTNGVFVDGQRIPVNERVPYTPDLTLSFGPVLSATFDLKIHPLPNPSERPHGSEAKTIHLELEDKADIERRKGKILSPERSKKFKSSRLRQVETSHGSEGLTMKNILAAIIVAAAIFWYFRHQ